MKKIITFVVTLTTTTSLAACSQNAQDQTAQAGNAVAEDMSATASNAGDRIDASTDHAA